ncbi:MAG: DUF2087 domain-containing protein [Usitatibacter sp.]
MPEVDAKATFKRLLANGPLTQIPKRAADQLLIARLAGTRFQPGRQYAEKEVNETLTSWLSTFFAEHGIDYATLRRFMVDMRILTRDRACTHYQVNEAGLAGVDAMLDPAKILVEASAERAARRQKHAG